MSIEFTLVSDSKYARIEYVPSLQTVVLRLKAGYVPIKAFMQVMGEIEDLTTRRPIVKMVFDKSNLTVFHQPSMEWYHVEWKTKMLTKGLKSYRKILPADRLFVEGVRIGREKIQKNYPDFDFSNFDISYCASLEDALAS